MSLPPTTVLTVMIVYAGLLLVGGIVGFVKAKSRPSLIAGVASAVLMVIAAWVSTINAAGGYLLGLAVALALGIFFGARFQRTRKFMPSGMMAAVCVVVEIVLLFATVHAFQMAA